MTTTLTLPELMLVRYDAKECENLQAELKKARIQVKELEERRRLR